VQKQVTDILPPRKYQLVAALCLVMISAKTFIKRNVSRNSCTTWQWQYWRTLYSAITVLWT